MPLHRAHDPERTELAVFANGIRDALGLVPLYTFDSNGRTREWWLGKPYDFYPKAERAGASEAAE